MPDPIRTEELNRALEALHLAYRQIIKEPDQLLATHGLTRVHHRILYIIGRHPGASIGTLLTSLDVSKQALNAPLRHLIHEGWIDAHADPENRRMKQLCLTVRGAALEDQLSGDQRRRFADVFANAGPEAERTWHDIMRQLAQR